MSTPINDGGPAFPVLYVTLHTGMSLRDWFAGMALQGKATRLSNPHEHRDLLAADCYDIADAMLKAREVNAR
jgi:hypothetical protein